ncbi:hypothetical protein P0Y43_05710 [Pseudomonas entomophila]|uniref:hypothetical protein n=1 Tax=Pseudomonas entomophila TaxID=312306 RepID=UPI0023D8940F|nr:hypothetical protein [Pseudomonas entomophila]MDF0730226.1 hypothetical protein [Pseudomonas entomophila]
MSAFTVYFSGTGSHSFDDKNPNFWNGELVSTLAANNAGREFVDWIAVDGPGSGNLQNDTLFVDDGDHFKITGTLFGNGWKENVQHALQVIKGQCTWQRKKLTQEEYDNLKRAGIPIPDASAGGSWFWRTYDYGDRPVTPQALQEQLIKQMRKPLIPTTVNLVGWSRGGISCHMLANAMADDPQLKDVAVNIFAIDPVPGIGNVQLERVQLATNVKEYVGYYARDERSKGFACVIPVMPLDARISIFPLPGRHATLVGNASVDGASGGAVLIEPGKIVRHFAEVCLTRWGTQLTKRQPLDDATLTQYHQAMAAADAQYQAMRKQSYTAITEGKEQRLVHHGLNGTEFSKVSGQTFNPAEGLAQAQQSADSYKALR